MASSLRDPAGGPPPHPRELHYSFDLANPGRVHVTLEYQALAPAGSEAVLLPSRWADVRGLERGIVNLHVTGPGAALEPTSQPWRDTVRAAPGQAVRLEYDLEQGWEGPFRSSERHRVLLRPNLVVFTGQNALVAPAIAPETQVRVVFDFSGLPTGEALVTSFGAALHQVSTSRWGDVDNALFVGGHLATRTVKVRGSPVLLATYGDWSFSEQELALKVQRILTTERAFWRDAAVPWYAVVLLPFESGSSGGGGTAFTNAFSLALAPTQSFDAEAESLFAHEAFHAWNPDGLGSLVNAAAIEWFVEGFTTYYQDVLLERSGLIDRAVYLDRLNTTLREYQIWLRIRPALLSAKRSLDEEEFAYREPYLRGAAIALWLDGQIAQQTNGRQSLADYMLALRSERERPLTGERLFRTAARFVDVATVNRFRGYAAGQAPVPIEVAALGPCVSVEGRPAWTFALGLPLHELRSGAIVRDLSPDGPAYQAGLRSGDIVQGWTVWSGDPDREAVITVTTPSGARKQVHFFPRGAPTNVQQVLTRPGCAAGRAADGALASTPSPW